MNSIIVTAFLTAAFGAATTASAGDLTAMLRTPGDWQVTMTGGFMPPTTQNACYRGDKSVADLTTSGLKNCAQQSLNITSGEATVDAVCSLMNMRVSVHARLTPTGDAAFHADTHVHLEGKPPIAGLPPEMTLSIEAHRVGECRPGEKVL